MPIEVTRRWTGSRLRQQPGDWTAEESFDVTGVATKSAAIQAVADEYPEHWDNNEMKIGGTPVAESLSGGRAFRVSTTYSFRGSLSGNSPLNEPTVVSGGFETISVAIDKDIDGNAIVNSASDPYEGLTDEETVFVLVVQKNIPFFSIAQGVRFTNAVNSNSFTLPGQGGVGVGQALCRVYQPVGESRVGDGFVRVQAVLAFREGQEPWQLYLKDQGRNGYYDDSGNKRRGHIVAQNGDEPEFDVALDGTGLPIATGYRHILKDPTLKSQEPVVDAIANPTLPTGLFVDTTRSSALAKILRWKRRRKENFGDLPF